MYKDCICFLLTIITVHLDHLKATPFHSFPINASSVHKYCQPFLYIRISLEASGSVCSMSIAIINIWFQDHRKRNIIKTVMLSPQYFRTRMSCSCVQPALCNGNPSYCHLASGIEVEWATRGCGCSSCSSISPTTSTAAIPCGSSITAEVN
jgi:hypothetical protein